MTETSKPRTAEPLYQFQTINHHGSFLNYGPPTRTEQWCENRRRGNGIEGQHYRFVRVN